MNENINFLLAGLGARYNLASDVLVNVGLAAGYQAKQAECMACLSVVKRNQSCPLGQGSFFTDRRRG
jgi:hypothetical protein